MKVENEKIKLAGLMILALFFYFLETIRAVPMKCPSDELGTMVSAAALAGCDWSGVIHGSGYYGFGFWSLFFWLFKLTDSPYAIYKTLICVGALCRVGIIPIVYYLLKRYFNVNNKSILYSLSFFASFLYSANVSGVANDNVLELFTWIIVLLVSKNIEIIDSKINKKCVYSLLLVLACFYVQLIHTRALVLVIATYMIMILVMILKKRMEPVSLIGIPVSYFVAKITVNTYQMYIWKQAGSEVRNGSATVSKAINIFDSDTWEVWGHMLAGMIGTETIVTAGIFIVSAVIFFHYMSDMWHKRSKPNIFFLATAGIPILAMGGTIAAFLVSGWFEGMYTTWGTEVTDAYYAYKGVLYVRYWDIYFPVFAITMLTLLEKTNMHRILNQSMFLIVATIVIFITYIIPLVHEHHAAAGFFFGVSMYRRGMTISDEFYMKGIAVSLFFCMLFYMILHSRRYMQVAFIVPVIFAVILQVNKACFYDLYDQRQHETFVDASYEMVCRLEKNKTDIGNIYVFDDTSETDYNANINSILQFFLMKYKIKENIPDQLQGNDIIITRRQVDEYLTLYKDIKCYKLDENEFWYTYMELNGE